MRPRTKWITGAAGAALATALLATGAGVASAASGTSAPATTNAANTKTCDRLPHAIARIDKQTTRIGGDATVKGSTAWMQAREQAARTAGHTAEADVLAARISDQAGRTSALGTLRGQLEHVQQTDCGGS